MTDSLNQNKVLLVYNHLEEIGCQTVIKGEEIEQLRSKNKNLITEIEELSDRLNYMNIREDELKQELCRKEKEISNNKLQLEILAKKLKEKSSLNQDSNNILYEISNFSNINTQITQLKLRESELLKKILHLENIINDKSGKMKDSDLRSVSEDKFEIDTDRLQTFGIEKKKNEMLNSLKSQNYLKNSIMSFGSDFKKLHTSNQAKDCKNTNNMNYNSNNKILEGVGVEFEIRKLKEDNLNLKQQNFHLLDTLTRLEEANHISNININDDFGKLKFDLNEKSIQLEKLIKENDRLTAKYNSSLKDNNEEIQVLRKMLENYNINTNEINSHMVNLQRDNQELDQQLSEKISELEELKIRLISAEKEKVNNYNKISSHDEITKKLEIELKEIERENKLLKQTINDMHFEFTDTINRAQKDSYIKDQKINDLIIEISKNDSINSHLKGKLNQFYVDIKDREEKMLNNLINEGKELESRLLSDLKAARKENELLLKEKSSLRIENNDLRLQLNEVNNKLEYSKYTSHDEGNSYSHNESFNQFLNENKAKEERYKVFNQKLNSRLTSKLRQFTTPNETESDSLKKVIDENYMLKKDLDNLLVKISNVEKEKSEIQMKFEAIKEESIRNKDRVKILQDEKEYLTKEVQAYRDNDSSQNLKQLISEIENKNQTINYLLEEFEKMKNETNEEITKLNTLLKDSKQDYSKLNDEFNALKNISENEKIESNENINNLKEENNLLVEEIENKEKELNKLNHEYLIQKVNYEEKIEENVKKQNDLSEKNAECGAELDKVKNLLSNEINNNVNKQIEFDEKLKKSSIKVEKLVELYESHIEFLKERYRAFINDMKSILLLKNTKVNHDEKLSNLIKTCESLGNLINVISQKEAAIEAFKSEVKYHKNQLNNLKAENQNLSNENKTLNEKLGIKVLQKKMLNNSKNDVSTNNLNQTKYKTNNKNVFKQNLSNVNTYNTYGSDVSNTNFEQQIDALKIQKENTNLNLQIKNLNVEIYSLKEEVKLFKDKLQRSEEKFELSESEKYDLENAIKEIEEKNSQNMKRNKQEYLKLATDLNKVKDKFVDPDSHKEALNRIGELEKQVKNLKEEVNRKKDLISHLKEKENSDNKQNQGKNELKSELITNDEVKNLSKEIKQKDAIIKDLRGILDKLKQENKQLSDENVNNTEKLKICKIDNSRKEVMIKELKEKVGKNYSLNESTPYINISSVSQQPNNVNNNTNSLNNNVTVSKQEIDKLKDTIKKLKGDSDRKDNLISTLKNKKDVLLKEIEEIKAANQRLKQFSSLDSYGLRDELENQMNIIRELNFKCEQLKSVFRKIFKDIVMSGINSKNKIADSHEMLVKEELNILNIDENEMNNYLLEEDNNVNQALKEFEELISSKEIDVNDIYKFYTYHKTKLIDTARDNIIKPNTQIKYLNLAKNIKQSGDDFSKYLTTNTKKSNSRTKSFTDLNSKSKSKSRSKSKENDRNDQLDNLDDLMENLKSINKLQ